MAINTNESCNENAGGEHHHHESGEESSSIADYQPKDIHEGSSDSDSAFSNDTSIEKLGSNLGGNRPYGAGSTRRKEKNNNNENGDDDDYDDDYDVIRRTQTEQSIISVLSKRASKVSSLNDNPELDDENTKKNYERPRRTSVTQNDKEKNIGATEQNNENNGDTFNYYQDDELELPTRKDGAEFRSIDPNLVTWEGEEDPKHPRNWPRKKKWITTGLVSCYAMVSPFSSSICSPSADSIAKQFGITQAPVQSMITSIFILAYAIVPLFISPISERFGRKVVLDVSIWVLFFFTIGCALSQNTAQILVFRFLAGAGGSTPLCVGAGVIGDLFLPVDRGSANTLFSLGPTVGPVLAPLIAGFIEENLGWRWNFWVMSIIAGVIAILGTIFYPETYSPTLLRWKCSKLRKETKNKNLKTIYDIADGSTIWDKAYVALALPFKFLFIHPMVYGLGAFQAFLYGLFYLLIVAFPSVYSNTYHFNKGIQGLMYISFGIGYGLGLIFWSRCNQRAYHRLTHKNNGVQEPEFRIYTLSYAAVLCSFSILVFGWTAQAKVHWIVPCIFAAIFSFAYLDNFLTIIVYVIDMNPRFAASAASALSFFRSVFGFVFPLFSPKMFSDIGYGWGCTIFFFIVIALGIPFPLFVLKNGKKLRLWANRIFEKDQAKRDARNFARLQKQNDLKLQTHISRNSTDLQQ